MFGLVVCISLFLSFLVFFFCSLPAIEPFCVACTKRPLRQALRNATRRRWPTVDAGRRLEATVCGVDEFAIDAADVGRCDVGGGDVPSRRAGRSSTKQRRDVGKIDTDVDTINVIDDDADADTDAGADESAAANERARAAATDEPEINEDKLGSATIRGRKALATSAE